MRALIDFCPTGANPADAIRGCFEAPRQILVANSVDQVRPLLESVHALAQQGLWCVGYLRYEAAPAFDAAFSVHEPDGPLACFGVFDFMQPWPTAPDNETASIKWQPGLNRSEFDQQMAAIHQAIAAGELYQVNYTAPLKGSFKGDPQTLFMALQRAQPNGYAAFIDTQAEQVLSVSPELFFDWHGEHILVRPMKGTAPRGANAEADAQAIERLQTSPKERAENVMIVDLIRNDLSRLAQPFSVRTPRLFHVEALPTVFQMSSDVQASTRPGTTLVDVFAALFPCGSITGAPKVRAMQMIKALEPQARGIYCGAIGMVRPGGHATFNVAIRTVTIHGNNARCGIGSGITADATANDEWQEWRHKRGFLERASQPFNLLETLRLEDGKLRDSPSHLARMALAAAHFSFPFDENVLKLKLHELSAQHPRGLWRVRLQLRPNGQALAETLPLPANPKSVVLQLASSPFEASDSEFVRFKTTLRTHYDAFAPTTPDVFDTLLWNRNGEITECTRGNIAVLIEGRWVTPPLHCGLLNGVARANSLRVGSLVEACVRIEDLPRVEKLTFINSLRGWINATMK